MREQGTILGAVFGALAGGALVSVLATDYGPTSGTFLDVVGGPLVAGVLFGALVGAFLGRYLAARDERTDDRR